MYKFFATKVEQVRYDTFKESQSYNDGMASELQAMQLNYVKADKEGKAAIASIILHRYASYDTTKLPPDLQVFLKEIKNERGLK